jgi:hypothetical protein
MASMNISANEMLLINKNLKFRGDESQQTPTAVAVAEPPVTTNPQAGLNALQAQGMNNMTFQGLNVGKTLKSIGIASMMAMATLTAGTALTSCTDIEQSVTVDMTAIMTAINEMKTLYQQMLEQQEITNTQMTQMNTYLAQLLKEVQDGNMTQQEFFAQMVSFMMDNDSMQQLIYNQLVQNGKTDSEAKDVLDQIYALMNQGKYEEALNKIYEILGSINGTLQSILEQLQGIAENLIEFRQSYDSNKQEELKLLGGIYNNGRIQIGQMADMQRTLTVMNNNIEGIKSNTTQLLEIASDDTKYQELLDVIKNSGVDYDKFEQMFKLLNMNITDVLKMSKSELIAAIKNFEKTYIETEAKQTEQLTSIYSKLEILASFPGLDQSGIEDAIKGLTDAVNGNTDAISGKLDAVIAKLESALAKLDTIIKQLGTISSQMKTYADGFNKKFDSALDKLITEFRTGIAGIRTDNQVANQYLKLLNQKSEEIIAAINELQNASKGSGMTLAEFEAYMNERDAAQYEKYKALIEALGIKLDKGNATLDDLLKAINAWKADQKDYTAQLNAILDKLDGINWSNPDYSSKLDKIIELLTEFKCNCSCTGNSSSNEGIIEDLDDLLS